VASLSSNATSPTPSPHILSTAAAHSGELSNAEILLWQGKFRRVFVLLLGFGTVALEWSDVISNDSVFARRVGADWAMMTCIVLILAYVAFNQVLIEVVRRRGYAGNGTIATAVAADLVLLFTLMFAGTPAVEYPRVLIVSIFTVQFTQLYFGARATVYHLAGVAVLYVIVVFGAQRAGVVPNAAEQFWDLALYLVGMLLFVVLRGQMSERLKRIIRVFERAQEGDFSLSYDESRDDMPDAITAVGRAYNRLRGNLEAILLTDTLSGCYNRRGFEKLTVREVSRAVRSGQSLAVLAIDVDHFKRINDEFGHLTGDEVIREMAALLRETARMGDVVARIGGEEFEVLAPNTNAEGAHTLAERILHAFRLRSFTSVGGRRKITISIGVASDVARNDEVAKVLIARADEALYVAKGNGRDRIELWHPGMRGLDEEVSARRALKAAKAARERASKEQAAFDY
jgi:diguanylate cyclase (GGDEF)-like protein